MHSVCFYRGQPKAGTGHKMLFVPFFFSTSRFRGPAFRCDKIVVIVTLILRWYNFTLSIRFIIPIYCGNNFNFESDFEYSIMTLIAQN